MAVNLFPQKDNITHKPCSWSDFVLYYSVLWGMQFYTCSFGGWDSTYIVLLHTLMMLQGFWTPLRCTASPSQLKVGHFREHPNPNGFMDTYHPVIKHGNGKSLYKWRLKNGKHSGVSIVMFDYRRVWRFFQERFMDCAISCIGNCNQQGINPTYFILQAVILSHCHVAHVFFKLHPSRRS